MTHIRKRRHQLYHKSRGLAVLSVLIVVAIFTLGFFYIIQTNSLIGHSYEIREQRQYLEELSTKEHDLEMQAAVLRSPATLEKMVGHLGMIEVRDTIYLDSNSTVAIR